MGILSFRLFFFVNTLFNFIFVSKYYEPYIEVLVCDN